jgi:hypothetical protein
MKNQIETIYFQEFEYIPETGKIKELETDKTCFQLHLKNQNPIIIIDIPFEKFMNYIGEC